MTPRRGLALFHPPSSNSRLKCFGFGRIDDPAVLRCPLECVTGQHAAAAASRCLNFLGERIRGPTAVREQQPHPLGIGGSARRQCGREFPSHVVENAINLAGRSKGPGFGTSKSHALDQHGRFALCRLEPHICNQRGTGRCFARARKPPQAAIRYRMDHDAICAKRKEQVLRQKSVDTTGGRQCTQLKASIDQYRVQRVLTRCLFEVFRKLDPCAREALASLNLTKAAESRTELRAQILEFGVDCIGGDRVCGNGV